jgi:hypothetical protein
MSKPESLINCKSCKIKRLKCNRKLPNCSNCLDNDTICIYSDKIIRKRANEDKLASFINKIKPEYNIRFRILTSLDCEKIETRARKFALFKPILQHNDLVDGCLQGEVPKMQTNGSQKFQTYILLMLSTQIVDYDIKLIPQIDFFVDKLELGVFERLLKFSIHMNQEWIVELLSPSFEEKCITNYFLTFHTMANYISKYKFYTNNNDDICPVLKSVIVLAGYSSTSKQSPELLKYLKHVAIVQLKKNMLNIRLSICQALFIFSCYLLFQGLGKQSLEYFHQAYLMASALGIHKDMPGLNEIDMDERRCIRFISYRHDSHLASIVNIQPYYLFLAPSWTPLNPIYQTNPFSKNPNEFLIAECICLFIKCFNIYWTISSNLMNKYSQLTLTNQQAFLKYSYTQPINVLQTLFNHSLIRTLDLHLSLSEKCKNSEELEIVKSFAKNYVGLYHTMIIVINSQLSPKNPTLELDQSTKKLLWSSQALYQNSIDVSPFNVPIFYQNLCTISLLYIKLILVYNNVPQVKELLLGKFKQVYGLFNSYRTKYNMPSDLIEAVDIIANYHKIKI